MILWHLNSFWSQSWPNMWLNFFEWKIFCIFIVWILRKTHLRQIIIISYFLKHVWTRSLNPCCLLLSCPEPNFVCQIQFSMLQKMKAKAIEPNAISTLRNLGIEQWRQMKHFLSTCLPVVYGSGLLTQYVSHFHFWFYYCFLSCHLELINTCAPAYQKPSRWPVMQGYWKQQTVSLLQVLSLQLNYRWWI